MASKLDILAKVMVSLKEDQRVVMDNITALLNNRDKETNLVDKLKYEMSELARIEGVMSQNDHFMVQLAQAEQLAQASKIKPKDGEQKQSDK